MNFGDGYGFGIAHKREIILYYALWMVFMAAL